MSSEPTRRTWPLGLALLLALAATALLFLAAPDGPPLPMTPTPPMPPGTTTPTAALVTVTPSPTRRVTATAAATLPSPPTIAPPPTVPLSTPTGNEPALISLRPCIGGSLYFATGTASFRAIVDWRGHAPGELVYTLAGRESRLPMSGPEASLTVVLDGLPSGPLPLTVHVEAAGLSSHSLSLSDQIAIVEHPAWWPLSQRAVQVAATCQGAPLTTTCHVLYPPEMLDGRVQVPVLVPFLGGHPLGLAPTQAELHATVNSFGEASLQVSGGTGLAVGGQRIAGSIHGDGAFALDGNRLVLDRGNAGLVAAGQVAIEKPLIEIICGAATGLDCRLRDLESTPIVGSVVQVFNELAELEARFLPALDTDLAFGQSTAPDGGPSALVWKGGGGSMALGMELALALDMMDQLGAEAYGGGTPSLSLQVPATNGTLVRRVDMSLSAGVRLYAVGMEADYPVTHIWSYTPSQGWSAAGGGPPSKSAPGLNEAPIWQPIRRAASGREYAAGARGMYVANDRPLNLSVDPRTAAADASLATERNRMVANAYPQGDPSLAITKEGATLVWVHDDVAKPEMQGTELLSTRYVGGRWSDPTAITNDALQDLSPRVIVARDSGGGGNQKAEEEQVLVVWERNRAEQDGNTRLDAAYVGGFEIAYAVWEGTRWTKPAYLTDNGVLDHDPHLVPDHDGRPLLVWRRNKDNALLGTAASPDLILFSVWQGDNWSTPQVLPLPIAGGAGGHHPLWFAAARHGDERMALVYVHDADGRAATPDRVLYAVEYNGLAWGAPRALTPPGAIMRPTLAYDSKGQPILTWLEGDTVRVRQGDWGAGTRDLVRDPSPGLMSHRALIDDAGNVTIAWSALHDIGPDLVAVRLRPDGTLTQHTWLTADAALEKDLAMASSAAGDLLLAYGASAMAKAEVAAGGATIRGVSQPTTTDLYVTRHTFAP